MFENPRDFVEIDDEYDEYDDEIADSHWTERVNFGGLSLLFGLAGGIYIAVYVYLHFALSYIAVGILFALAIYFGIMEMYKNKDLRLADGQDSQLRYENNKPNVTMARAGLTISGIVIAFAVAVGLFMIVAAILFFSIMLWGLNNWANNS